ncbi:MULTISPECIES: hypothetical protein [Emticicia]|uniref:hypothetical protein n=1 Tax=Emticicia TaxID=312278 RepID=UPI0020A1746D|nr:MULTISPECIES: hypothetical protein [Emticicia]UTA68724.1 hypothetical protein MB380_02715 [Emticicia sp. 21SJ11W-3]
MIRIFTLTLAASILTIKLFSQDIYRPAKIVNLKGDTSQVILSNFSTTSKISYKLTSNDKAVEVSPNSIKGYITNGNIYLSKEVYSSSYRVDNSFSEFPFIKSGSLILKNNQVQPHREHLYLKLLVKGEVSLYQLTTQNDINQFYIEKDEKMHELPPVYYDFKPDSIRNNGFFIIKGQYYQTNRFRGGYIEQKPFTDTLDSILFENKFALENGIKQSLKTLNYTAKDLIAFIVNYNTLYTETKPEIIFQKKKLGKIYFGFTAGGTIPIKDRFTSAETKFTNAWNYNIYVLIPNYGKNQNIFYKLGFHYYSYSLLNTDKNTTQKIEREIASIALGVRYASLKGEFRPYAGFSATFTQQKADGVKLLPKFPLVFELGGIIPLKRTNIVFQTNFSPLLNHKQNWFKQLSYGVGLMF